MLCEIGFETIDSILTSGKPIKILEKANGTHPHNHLLARMGVVVVVMVDSC